MDAALDSGVRRSPRRVFRLAGAGVLRRLAAGTLLVGMIGSPLSASADETPAPAPTASPSATATTGDDPQAPAVDPGTVSVSLAPDNAGVLQAGQDLGLTVSVTNTTSAALPAGTIHAVLDRSQLDSRAELSSWQNPSTSAVSSRDALSTDVGTPGVAAGATATFRASLPAAQLGLTEWGVYGVDALYTATSTIVDARSTVVWSVGAPGAETPVAVIMPLTVPAGDRGLLTAAELDLYTAPGGVLNEKLDAVLDTPATLAIDPRVTVSIRVLGTAAPQSALDWLARLAAASNPTFALAFGDADIAVERQAGVTDLLKPTSFDYALQAANFQAAPTPDPFALPGQVDTSTGATGQATATATGTGDPGSTPTPTPQPTPGTLPTTSELLAWNYTRSDLAWPADSTVMTDDLNFFAAAGLTTTILSSDNVALPSDSAALTPTSPVTIGDKTAVVVDSGLSDALQNAAAAPTEAGRGAALAQISAILAVVTGQAGTSRPALVADLGRGAPSSSAAVGRSLDLLESLPWSTERGLDEVLSGPTLGVSVRDAPEPDSRRATVSAMLDLERRVTDYAPVISKPELLTGQQRATLLAVLAQSWADDPTGRTAAEASYATLAQNALGSVKIIDGSNINLFATSSEVPVLISNDLAEAVTVELQVTPSNGRLVVEPGRIEVVVEAKSQKTARVPVKAAVASGEVNLRLQLFNPTGVEIDQAAPRQINVSADWEGIGTIVISSLAALLLAFGIVRQVLKRRRATSGGGAGGNSDSDTGSGSGSTGTTHSAAGSDG